MRNRSIVVLFIFISVIALIFSDAPRNTAISHATGAPAGRTGSPGDGGLTCTSCHSGPSAATQTGWITSNVPAGGYVPGNTYTITATATRPNHVEFGFEISPQNMAGTLLGVLIITNATQTKLVGANKYITHTSSGISGTGSKTWTFDWTAPIAGTGNVTFYGAFNVTNNNNSSSGDTIYKSTLLISECSKPAQPSAVSGKVTVCAGSSQTYSVTNDPLATGYNWTLPPGWTGTSVTNSITVSAGSSGGTISVYAINACGNGTARTLTVTVTQVSVSFSALNLTCNGSNNGSATAIPSGGTAPYTYLWSVGSTLQTISNLPAGTYTVTITDANSCVGSSSVVISQPAILSAGASHTNATCNGICNGTLSATASGGMSGYTYSWSGGLGSGNSKSNICPGIYTVTVTDANGCTSTASTTVTQPAIVGVSAIPVNVACNGLCNGTLSASGSGGTSPYTYSWSGGLGTGSSKMNICAGTYTVTVTDAAGCTSTASATVTQPAVLNASASSTSATCNGLCNGTLSASGTGGTSSYSYVWSGGLGAGNNKTNVCAGMYIVTVTDANGCTSTSSASVTQPTLISVNVNSTNASCGFPDGTASVVAANGTPPYTYLWSVNNTTSSITGLAAGIYTVAVTDANSCTRTASAAVINNGAPSISINNYTDVSCFGDSTGEAGISVTGGTMPYTILWSNGDSDSVTTSLTAGNYSVSVTDSNGCIAIVSVTITEPPALMPIINSVNVNCNGGLTGQINLSVSGGVLPYTYLWSNSETTASLDSLAAGNYAATITDGNGCILNLSDTITEPPVLVADAGNSISICEGDTFQTGGTPSASGGVAPYLYLWNPSSGLSDTVVSNPFAFPGISTAYTLTVTDSNGCTALSVNSVTVNMLPTIPTITQSNDTLFSSVSDSYQWYVNGSLINGATAQFYVPVQNGDYEVMITDVNGCSATSVPYTYVNSGIPDDAFANGLIIYPNPSTGIIKIENNNTALENIKVYNTLSQQMYDSGKINLHEFEIDLSGLVDGVCFIKVNNVLMKKFIVER